MKCIVCNNDCDLLYKAKYYFNGFNYCSACNFEYKIYNESIAAIIKVINVNSKEFDFYLNFLNARKAIFTIYDHFADKKILQEEVNISSFKEGAEYLNKVSQKFINNLLFI